MKEMTSGLRESARMLKDTGRQQPHPPLCASQSLGGAQNPVYDGMRNLKPRKWLSLLPRTPVAGDRKVGAKALARKG